VLEPLLIWATPGQRGFAPPAAQGGAAYVHQMPGPGYPGSGGGGGAYASGSQAGGAQYGGAYAPGGTQYPAGGGGGGPHASQAGAKAGAKQTAAQQAAVVRQQEALARARELQTMLSTLERVDDEGRRASLLDTLCAQDDILGLPEHDAPPGVASGELRVDLLKHQVRARERGGRRR
jgi:SWI/SNF-related matrix-associated actin-dependent regulator of chromatin subfamily A3